MTRKAAPRDAGLTLVELVITCGMLGVVLMLVASVTLSFAGSSQASVLRQRDSDEARAGMAVLAGDLDRAITPSAVDELLGDAAIVQAGHNTLTFWAALDTGSADPRRAVRIERCASDSTLMRVEGDTPPDSPCQTGTGTVIARNVAAGVFTYWDRATLDPGGLPVAGAPLGSDVAADQIGEIGSVEAVLSVHAPEGKGRPATVIRRFHLTSWKDL